MRTYCANGFPPLPQAEAVAVRGGPTIASTTVSTPMASSTHQIEARVQGRVQGVGFRAFTTRRAQQLGLSGWVRNEPDGSVRVVAEGSEDDLHTLLDHLRHGPPASRVSDVSATWDDATGEFDGFRVRYR